MPVVSTLDSKAIQATILALKTMRADLRKEIYGRARSQILPEWNQTLANEIGGDILASRLLMKNTRVKIGTQGVTIQAATRKKASVSGGLQPNPQWYLAEYGAVPRKVKVRGRRGNTQYEYERMVNTGMKPRRRAGYYGGPAADKIVKRVLALWVSSTFQLLYESFDKGKKNG